MAERLTATETIEKLKADFNVAAKNDEASAAGIAAFKKDYIEYLSRFPEFHNSIAEDSDKKTSIAVPNAMFGGENFRLKATTEGKVILQKSGNAQKIYGKMSIEDRLEFLDILKKKIVEHQKDIILTITADCKPIDLATGEVSKASAWFDFADANAKKQLEKSSVTVGNKKYETKTSYEPAGIVQVIGAFNYPLALTLPGIVGGLASGNSVVVSTPEKAPNWIFPFMQAASEAVTDFAKKHKLNPEAQKALKDGLIQYSIGRDPTISNKADVVHFVGGDVAGKAIKKARGDKPTILELGGSNVVTVMNDAVTNDAEAKEIVKKIYGGFGPTTGQRCTAPRILLVEKGEPQQAGQPKKISAETVAEKLEAMCAGGAITGSGGIGNPFIAATKKLDQNGTLELDKDGKPIEIPGTRIGALVDNGAYKGMQEMITLASRVGATVHGKLDANMEGSNLPKGGHWVNPIAIDWSEAEKNPENAKEIYAKIKEKEIFGPLIHIMSPVKDIEEAITKTNELDTHNLASAIFTKSEAIKNKYFKETNAVSQSWNEAPSDKSPKGEHGHPDKRHGLPIHSAAPDGEKSIRIGGDNHFLAYCKVKLRKIANDLGEAISGTSR